MLKIEKVPFQLYLLRSSVRWYKRMITTGFKNKCTETWGNMQMKKYETEVRGEVIKDLESQSKLFHRWPEINLNPNIFPHPFLGREAIWSELSNMSNGSMNTKKVTTTVVKPTWVEGLICGGGNKWQNGPHRYRHT